MDGGGISDGGGVDGGPDGPGIFDGGGILYGGGVDGGPDGGGVDGIKEKPLGTRDGGSDGTCDVPNMIGAFPPVGISDGGLDCTIRLGGIRDDGDSNLG